ncbi:MAG: GNAT family N-acetyltransferase [Hyphomicrobiaceae bacterium]
MIAATDLIRIRGLEERAFNAWPALSSVLSAGWVMRFADGYTKRANSLNAWMPECPLEAFLPEASALYAHAQLPMIVRLSPLAGPTADDLLEAQGYKRIDETVIMTVPLSAELQIDREVSCSRALDYTWANGFAAANGVPEAHRTTHDAMLSAIRWPVAFAQLIENGEALAWGLAVSERGKVGLFDIVTRSAARRRGIGRRLVMSLLAWGQRQGAHEAYLQVVATNTPAIHLYRELGFTEAYRYHYRIAP